MRRRLKVLVSAYACESGKGSEPGVGWNWVNQIARFNDVWVITRESNRQSIESGAAEVSSDVNWIYFDFPTWFRFWKKGDRGIHLYYYLWQMAIYFIARRLHKEEAFDLVHHLTFGVYWMPSFLSLLPVPFIYGPLGGAESVPREFYRSFSLKGKIYEQLRNVARFAGEKDPFVLMSIRKADVVLAKVKETEERLSLLGAKSVRICPESGISMKEFEKLTSVGKGCKGRFRLVSIGRLLHWKGFHLSLRAFSDFARELPHCEYWIIGDGPERRGLELEAQRLSISDRVRFLGALPHTETLRRMAECDVLVHPSLHDSGGWVCLEAMALGKPVLCIDIGGPGMQITQETGIKLRAEFPEQIIDELRNAMRLLGKHPNLALHMGKAARQRVAELFEWDKKGEWINKLYQELVI